MRKSLFLILLWVAVSGFYGVYKSMPEGTNFDGQVYNIPDSSVKFLYDRTYLDKNIARQSEQEIFDEIFGLKELLGC